MSTIKNTKNPELSDSVVLITGALTGIGRATALAFAKEKSSIVISGRHTDEGNKLATELRTYGAKAEFILADVTHDDEISNLIRKTVDKFGKIDIAINNAGTEGQPGLVVDQTAESYAATFDTNVLGTLLSMKHEMKLMIDQGHGSIINVSSTLGRKGYPGASVYSASKHAVEGLTKSAALEVAGSGIRINVVAPGPIETPMLGRFIGTEENKKGLAASVPAGRIGLPEEVAQTILFIGSNKAPYLTGQSIAIDGGILA